MSLEIILLLKYHINVYGALPYKAEDVSVIVVPSSIVLVGVDETIFPSNGLYTFNVMLLLSKILLLMSVILNLYILVFNPL